MRIELAYPYDGHDADETIEVSAAVARNLVESGRARKAPPAPEHRTRPVTTRATPTTTPRFGVHTEEA